MIYCKFAGTWMSNIKNIVLAGWYKCRQMLRSWISDNFIKCLIKMLPGWLEDYKLWHFTE